MSDRGRYQDRPRRAGENRVDWAVATGRVTSERAEQWRAVAAAGGDVEMLDHLSPALAGLEMRPAAASAAEDPEAADYRRLFGSMPGRPDGTVAAVEPPPPGTVALSQPDAFAVNPLVAALRDRNPSLYAAALRDGPPPQLFSGGPLPPFTASGVDVSVIAGLPWAARHAAASEPNRAKVLRISEDCRSDPEVAVLLFATEAGNLAYAERVRQWAAGPPSSGSPYQ